MPKKIPHIGPINPGAKMAQQLSLLKSDVLSHGIAERVEVNQRHLIDKILARYSAEFTIYREMLQNANDAGAKQFKLKFDLNEDGLVKTLCFINDGRIFTKEDWSRLCRIAEGNPDENKIGFFGVGFYSLFSISEEPLVTSGDTCLAFYWEGDQLYTRRQKMNSSSDETTIFLDIRKPFPLPNFDDLAEFMAFVQDELKFKFQKQIKANIVEKVSIQRMRDPRDTIFKLPVQYSKVFVCLKLTKKYKSQVAKKGILSRMWKTLAGEDKCEISFREEGEWDVEFAINRFQITTDASDAFMAYFYRITKKYPSKQSIVSILLPLSKRSPKELHPVLSKIIPQFEQGKVFLGFETHQTTGGMFHVDAPFIPTVERESIDFVDETLKKWNEALLICIGKILRNLYDQSASTENAVEELPNLVDVLAFQLSSPSHYTGAVICETFHTCSKVAISVPTSMGIRSITAVRTVPQNMRCFLKLLPQVTIGDSKLKQIFMENLKNYYQIHSASLAEIITEADQRVFSVDETINVLKWIFENADHLDINETIKLKQRLTFSVNIDGEEMIKAFSDFKFYADILFEDLPYIPTSCLPLSISKHFSSWELSSLELYHLAVGSFLDLCKKETNLFFDKTAAEKTLKVLSKMFSELDSKEKLDVANHLSTVACIPTTFGLHLPSLAYFESVKLLENLPVISFQERNQITDLFLKEIGVKSHLSVADIFANLRDWNSEQLMEYLLGFENELSENERTLLKELPIFQDLSGSPQKLSDLYLESEIAILTNVPILKWSTSIPENSKIGLFLIRCGLNLFVPLKVLLETVPNVDKSSQIVLLDYFAYNYRRVYYQYYKSLQKTTAFVPTEQGIYTVPHECFLDTRSKLLGFCTIRPDVRRFAHILGVEEHPKSELLIEQFMSRNLDADTTTPIFEYMARCQSEFSRSHWKRLATFEFIPVSDGVWKRPSDVFFQCNSADWQELFTQIDFGQQANIFLRASGVKESPSSVDLATKLSDSPERILNLIGGQHYLNLLRKLAVEFEIIMRESPATLNRLKNCNCLIGFSSQSSDQNDDQVQMVLAHPKEIFLVDDSISGQLFELISAPSEPQLEMLYLELGCRKISEVVSQSWYFFGSPRQSESSRKLLTSIRLRAPLFCSNMSATSSEIIENWDKLLQNLNVFEVDSIEIRRKYLNTEKVTSSSSCLKDSTTLLVTEIYDSFDVALAVSKLIYTDSKLSDALLISSLLTMSLSSLQAKGFPVEKLKSRQISGEATVKRGQSPTLEPYQSQDRMIELQKPSRKESTIPPGKEKDSKRSSILDAFKKALKIADPSKKIGKESATNDQIAVALDSAARSCRSGRAEDFDFEETKGFTGIQEDSDACQLFCHDPGSIKFKPVAEIEGIPLFIDKTLQSNQAVEWIQANLTGIQWFTRLLIKVGKIFGLNESQIHLFYAPETKVIAFNRNRSLFFGIAHYALQVEQRTSATTIASSWYVTMAHELAHNFTGNHDRLHEFYMSAYIETYMEHFMEAFK